MTPEELTKELEIIYAKRKTYLLVLSFTNPTKVAGQTQPLSYSNPTKLKNFSLVCPKGNTGKVDLFANGSFVGRFNAGSGFVENINPDQENCLDCTTWSWKFIPIDNHPDQIHLHLTLYA